MKIKEVIIRELVMKLKHPFTTSVGTETEKAFLLAEVRTDKGVSGWGEGVSIAEPIYNEETISTNWAVLREQLLPTLFQTTIRHPDDAARAFQYVRRNYNAKALLDGAIWDAYAKEAEKPLYEVLGGEKRPVDVGISIGIKPSMGDVLDTITKAVEEGYKRIKVKVKPGWDIELLKLIREQFPDISLMADANCAYALADIDHLRRFDDFQLMMIEQPLAEDDIIDHARLQRELHTPICLDESLHSDEDVRKALELDSCRIVNMKIGRVGGLSEARRIHTRCKQADVPLWCGGMLEAGIGRAHNVALTTLPGFTLPGDTAPSSHYWEQDIIQPEVKMFAGQIMLPEEPGIGFEPDMDRIHALTVRSQTFVSR
ncbi:o-succinylbenzoate synthase [Bacillus daqingensis]|uniref:o-succinylbenzoate synthase n=1 Tax=Bacillus daqingensis TaxID=872396 RepID=A0ABV9NSU4_9BACI